MKRRTSISRQRLGEGKKEGSEGKTKKKQIRAGKDDIKNREIQEDMRGI